MRFRPIFAQKPGRDKKIDHPKFLLSDWLKNIEEQKAIRREIKQICLCYKSLTITVVMFRLIRLIFGLVNLIITCFRLKARDVWVRICILKQSLKCVLMSLSLNNFCISEIFKTNT